MRQNGPVFPDEMKTSVFKIQISPSLPLIQGDSGGGVVGRIAGGQRVLLGVTSARGQKKIKQK